MKGKNNPLMLWTLLAIGLLLCSSGVFAQTVVIDTAETTMQDLDALAAGATSKTAQVSSTGSVTISSDETTDPAIWAGSSGWDVTVSSGATVSGVSAGINFNTSSDASGDNLAGTVTNSGTITGNGTADYVYGVNSGDASVITNNSEGTISGTTSGSYGFGVSTGNDSTILNSGTISGTATGSYSTGVSTGDGSTISNSGTISGSTTDSYGIGVSTGSGSTITNSGSISGFATESYGIGVSMGDGSTITNSGTISSLDNARSYGIYSSGGINVTNTADGVISATSSTDKSFGIMAGSNTTVDNSGEISATTSDGTGAYGIYTGDGSTITNRSDATISTSSSENTSVGVFTGANSTVTNDGTISVSNSGNTSAGVYAGASSTVTNESDGTITVSGSGNYVYGIRATNVTNNGTITASGASFVYGIFLSAGGTATNGDTITVTGSAGETSGISATNGTIVNNGVVTVTGTDGATYGINTTGSTGSSVTNSGEITVSTSGSGKAYGVNISNGTLTNASGGTISASGTAGVYGVNIGTGTVTNESGATITSDGGSGVRMTGTSTLNNYGAISGDIGVQAKGNATICNYNGGSITGTGGVAISLTGDNNSVLIEENSTISGSINSTGDGNTVEFNGAGTLDSDLTGTLAFIKSGSGTLELTGTNTYTGGTTVSDGILQGNSTSLQGDILNYGQVTFNQTTYGTYDGAISGTGALLKIGKGMLTITGDNTYTGTTTIDAGALEINGSITSPVTVNTGGALMGIGVISGNVTNYGTISAGNSIGTMTINGNLTFASGSTYEVAVTGAGQSNKLAVTGTTTINGSTVSVLSQSTAYKVNTKYTILTSDGGINGTFNNVTSDLVFLMPSLSYDSDDIYLTLLRNSTSFADVAMTQNQHAVASSLDRIPSSISGDMGTVVSSFLGLSAKGARSAYEQAGGLTHAALAETSSFAFQQYLDVVSARSWGDFGKSSPSFGWIKGFGSSGSRDGDDISSEYDYQTGGTALGYDHQIGKRFSVGGSVGYTAAKVNMDNLNDTAKVSVYEAALYGSYQAAPWYVNGVLAYGYHRYDTIRQIDFSVLDRWANATYNGHSIGSYVEAGYDLNTHKLRVTPLASLSAAYMVRNGFTEEGADSLNLNVEKEHNGSFISSLGARVKKEIPTPFGAIAPEGSLRWQHEFGAAQYQIDAAFSGYPSSVFQIQTDSAARDRAVIGLGIAWAVRPKLDLAINYNGTVSSNRSQSAAALGLKYKW